MFYSIWNVSACQVKRNPPRPPLQPDDKTLFTWVLQNQWQQQPAASHGKKPASRSAASPPVVLAAPPPAVLWYVASSRASNPLVRHDGCALAAGRPPPHPFGEMRSWSALPRLVLWPRCHDYVGLHGWCIPGPGILPAKELLSRGG